MTSIHMMRLAAVFTASAIVAFAALVSVARADEPGPGGDRPVVSKTGEEVYRNVCAACHMQDAKGGTGAGTIPALAKNQMLGTPEYPIQLVLAGRGAMPAFKGMLTDQQIADVVTYVRTHFGNAYKAPVTAAQVKAQGAN